MSLFSFSLWTKRRTVCRKKKKQSYGENDVVASLFAVLLRCYRSHPGYISSDSISVLLLIRSSLKWSMDLICDWVLFQFLFDWIKYTINLVIWSQGFELVWNLARFFSFDFHDSPILKDMWITGEEVGWGFEESDAQGLFWCWDWWKACRYLLLIQSCTSWLLLSCIYSML